MTCILPVDVVLPYSASERTSELIAEESNHANKECIIALLVSFMDTLDNDPILRSLMAVLTRRIKRR